MVPKKAFLSKPPPAYAELSALSGAREEVETTSKKHNFSVDQAEAKAVKATSRNRGTALGSAGGSSHRSSKGRGFINVVEEPLSTI